MPLLGNIATERQRHSTTTTTIKGGLKDPYEIGWWTPYLEGLARTFRPWDGPKYSWCHPIKRRKSLPILEMPKNGIAPKGVIYVKSPKTSSSTCAGINIAIARRVAHQLELEGQSNNVTIMAGNGNIAQCEHYDQHSFASDKGHVSRNRTESIMWTFVRHPRLRDFSWVYFRLVSINGYDPNDFDALIGKLPSQRARQSLYIDAGPRSRDADVPNTMMDHKSAAEYIRDNILDLYDFIGIVERQLESLAVMTLLWDLDPTTVIVLNSKQAGGFAAMGKGKNCTKLTKASKLPLQLEQYFNTSEYIENHADFLLYYAVQLSLDRTIQSLGVQRVEERANLLQELSQLAEEKCRDKAIFPCSGVGFQNPKANCYSNDSGCGYQCIDKVMDDYRQGKISLGV